MYALTEMLRPLVLSYNSVEVKATYAMIIVKQFNNFLFELKTEPC